MSPGNAAAPGVGAEGERNVQQGRADTSSRIPANLFGRYAYDVETGATAEERQQRQAVAHERMRSLARRGRASRTLNAVMVYLHPAPADARLLAPWGPR